MRALVRVVVIVASVLSLPAALWAFFHLPLVANDLVLALYARGYHQAVFEPEWSVWEDGSGDYMVGTVAGRRERASVRPFLPRLPTSENDLEDLTAGLATVPVLYNPGISAVTFEGLHAKVLPVVEDVVSRSREKLLRDFVTGYGPALALTALALGLSLLTRQKPGCWLGTTLMILGMQAVFGVLLLASPVLP